MEVLYSELGRCENSSKADKSMTFGMMLGIDHANKLRGGIYLSRSKVKVKVGKT